MSVISKAITICIFKIKSLSPKDYFIILSYRELNNDHVYFQYVDSSKIYFPCLCLLLFVSVRSIFCTHNTIVIVSYVIRFRIG